MMDEGRVHRLPRFFVFTTIVTKIDINSLVSTRSEASLFADTYNRRFRQALASLFRSLIPPHSSFNFLSLTNYPT